MQEPVDVIRILQTAFGFWSSKTLLSAVELGVFSALDDRALTAAELGKDVGVHPRAQRDFFDALVCMRFLEREGDGEDALYRNTEAAKLYLDERSSQYIGGALEMASARLYRFWNDLPKALRTGSPQNEVRHTGKPLFEALYSELPRLEQFLGAMVGFSRHNVDVFAERFDFSRYKTLCDAGGATGLLSITVAKRHPHMRLTTFDLPAVEPIARRRVEAEGLADRVMVVSGDFFEDPLPKADVITMGLVLHDWSLPQKKHLIRAAYDALPPGGAFVAIENLIDDARRENLFGLLSSLNMLIETTGGFDFTAADFRAWCKEAGFERFEIIPLEGPASAAVAYK